jgi:hypothetical protein
MEVEKIERNTTLVWSKEPWEWDEKVKAYGEPQNLLE